MMRRLENMHHDTDIYHQASVNGRITYPRVVGVRVSELFRI